MGAKRKEQVTHMKVTKLISYDPDLTGTNDNIYHSKWEKP